MRSRIARCLAAGAVVGVAFALGACSTREQKSEAHIQRAQEFEDKGQLDEALLELRTALQFNPKNADVNFRIGELLVRQGHAGGAAFFYHEATRLDPTRSDAALAEAKLILFEDTARATELVDKVIEREPKNATAYIRRSEIALARGKSADALQAAQTAAELSPDDGMTHMQLGIVQLARVREATVKHEPIPEEIYQAAEKEIKRAAELFPHGVVARSELGHLYTVWPGHLPQAEAAYRDAIASADSDEQRAKAAAAATSFARATQNQDFLRFSLQTLIAAAPGALDGWDELAAIEEQREKGAGDAVYKQLLEKRPKDVQAHIHFANFLFAHERYDEAFQDLESQTHEGSSDPVVALDEIVALRLRRGEVDAARATVDRMVKDFPNRPRTDLAKGRLALADGRADEAADALRRYVGSEETAEGQRLLALAELRLRNYPSAVAAVDRALLLEPTADLLRLKAGIHSSAGDYPAVLQTLNRLVREGGELRPSDKLLYAQALYATGRKQAGKAVLEEQLATENPPVGFYLEFAQREGTREPERARQYLERLIQQQPGNPAALRILAQFDLGAGHPEAALARIDQAAAAKPLTPELILLRAQVLFAQKDLPHAEEEARRAFAAQPNLPGALELLAGIYVQQNRVNEAIASFQEAENVGALPVSGEQLLARLQLAAGHRAEAKALFEKVVAARTDMPGAKNDLAWMLAEDGTDLERALRLAQEAQQAEPESSEIADTLGYVYLKKGLFDPALQQFKYAIELAQRSETDAQPERPEYYYHVGLALKSLGRSGEAASAFEHALQLDAKFANADDARRELEAAKTAAASGPG